MPKSRARSPVATKDMLIGALLRVPAQAIQRRIITELNAAGFDELRVPHDILRDIEREWSTVLGSKRFAELKELLLQVWDSPLARGPAGMDSATARVPERDA